jgi:GNAT superfamily N-acetyltransferase
MALRMIDVRPVRSRADLKAFVRFPERLYRAHPSYVPKLATDEMRTLQAAKNPAFDYCEAQCWMAFRDGTPVGRIAGIVNRRYIEAWGLKRARFGWIDFVDDPEVSSALLATVEGWAAERGLDAVHGPLGFCDLDREGMLVDGFDELDMLITIYNHPYYPAHLERLGYVKDADWLEYVMEVPAVMPENVDRLSRVVLDRARLKLVPTTHVRDVLPYAGRVFGLINDAYRDLYSVVAVSDRQVEYYTRTFFGFLRHEFVKVIVDADDNVAAFGIAMPSLSRALQRCRGRLLPFGFLHILHALRYSDRLDLLLTAVRPEYQNKGINAVLINEVWRAAVARRMRWAETGPELETNEKIQAQWKHFAPRQHRRRRCYVKELPSSRLTDANAR